MTLPNFIGLGVQKGGTSWLYHQLQNHPDVFVPHHRKEIHFFDVYYERGIEWYANWFENKGDAKIYGEITPDYIYYDDVAPYIQKHLPNAKFIIMLRHPVERAFSHYQMIFQSGEGQDYRDFDDFMENHPHGFKRGLYTRQLKRFFDLFDRDQFLILVSEEVFCGMQCYENLFETLGNFLGIDINKFDRRIAERRIGGARLPPRYAALARFAQKLRTKLRDWNMDWVAQGAKKLGLTRKVFGAGPPIAPLSIEQNQRWMKAYKDDIAQLETLLGRSFAHWT